MTQDEIIEMVMQIGGCERPEEDSPALKMFVTFANLLAAKEREACAKLCENMAMEWEDQPQFARIELATMMDCALAIRARGEQA